MLSKKLKNKKIVTIDPDGIHAELHRYAYVIVSHHGKLLASNKGGGIWENAEIAYKKKSKLIDSNKWHVRQVYV